METIPVWKKIVFYCITTAVSLCLLEFGFRVLGFQPIGKYFSPEEYFWISDNNLGFRNRQNGTFQYDRIKIKPVSTTDRYGYRNGYGWETESNKPIVLFVGDSVIFCAEVNDENTVTSEVAKIVTPAFNIRVLNAGVRGYNTVQVKRMLMECINRFDNIVVAVYVYCSNDYLHNLNPLAYYPAKSPYVWWNEDRSALSEKSLTDTLIHDGESIFDNAKKNRPLYMQVINLLERRFVVVNKIGTYSGSLLKLARQKKSAGNDDTSNKGQLSALAFGRVEWSDDQEVKKYNDFARSNGATEAVIELLRQMKNICEKKNIVFLSTSFARSKEHPDLNNEFPKIALDAGVNFIDISKYFSDEEISYTAQTSTGSHDGHYGEKGTKTFAKALSPEIEKILLSMPSLKKQSH